MMVLSTSKVLVLYVKCYFKHSEPNVGICPPPPVCRLSSWEIKSHYKHKLMDFFDLSRVNSLHLSHFIAQLDNSYLWGEMKGKQWSWPFLANEMLPMAHVLFKLFKLLPNLPGSLLQAGFDEFSFHFVVMKA